MIVKDEASIILECLASTKLMVDYILIEDTGSSDGTQELARSFLSQHGIPGEIIEEPWQDFAYNRTHALRELRKRTEIDYAFVLDADEMLVYHPEFDPLSFKQGLVADAYHVEVRMAPLQYYRPQIFRNNVDFRYRGVLHEMAQGPDGSTDGTAVGFHVSSGRKGARNQSLTKYHDDAIILERALETETDPFLVARYTFYLAQSYRDSDQFEKALQCYQRRAQLGFWDQEIFISLYQAASMKERLGHEPSEVVGTYLQAYEVCPWRVEALHSAMYFCRNKQMYNQGFVIGKHAITIPQPGAGLFLQPWVYEYGVLDEFSVLAFWSGHYQECFDACMLLVGQGRVPENLRARILTNAELAKAKMAG